MPALGEAGERLFDARKRPVVTREWVNEDDFVELLAGMRRRLPEASTFEIHNLFFPQVCPTALVNLVVDALVRVEASCAEYKHDIVDDDLRAQLLGFRMPLVEVLEAFDVIRGTKAEFQRHELEALRKKDKPSSGPPPKGKK